MAIATDFRVSALARTVGQPAPWRALVRELDAQGSVAWPLAASNLGQVLIGVVDAAVIGRLGALELGAYGLGSTLFFTVAVPATGLLLGYEPLIAQALGASARLRARELTRNAIAVALAVSLPLTLAGALATHLLGAAGVPASTAAAASSYLLVRLIGLPAHLAFVALRSYAQAIGRAPAVLGAIVVANAVHLPSSLALVHGDALLAAFGVPGLGLPALGLEGAALAAIASTATSALVLGLALGRAVVTPARASSRRGEQARALSIGAPIALSMLAEQGGFMLLGVLVGSLDPGALAAHQVAMTFAGGVFVVPVAIGAAASVRVGTAIGHQDGLGARRAGWVATASAAAVMAIAALVFGTAPASLAALVTHDAAVVTAAVPLLRIAAVFALFDGVQVALTGALRGAGDTRLVCLANLSGYYVLAAPVGVVLALRLDLGAVGLWWGLCLGLAAVALVLASRFAVVSSAWASRERRERRAAWQPRRVQGSRPHATRRTDARSTLW